MYTFVDALNGESLTLRPEGTAVVRARGDRAQPAVRRAAAAVVRRARCSGTSGRRKGRYRQFHQFGVEALGFAGPGHRRRAHRDVRAAVALLGLEGIELELNTLGSAEARARYRARLVEYLERHADALDADSQRRLHTQSAARARQQEPGDAGDDRRRAAA